jgi:CII-binding regulator of phage lambda lysogenization HflD
VEADRSPQSSNRIAETIRAACVQAAQQGYERAAADGLCDEGALEVALDAIRSLDIESLLRELRS